MKKTTATPPENPQPPSPAGGPPVDPGEKPQPPAAPEPPVDPGEKPGREQISNADLETRAASRQLREASLPSPYLCGSCKAPTPYPLISKVCPACGGDIGSNGGPLDNPAFLAAKDAGNQAVATPQEFGSGADADKVRDGDGWRDATAEEIALRDTARQALADRYGPFELTIIDEQDADLFRMAGFPEAKVQALLQASYPPGAKELPAAERESRLEAEDEDPDDDNPLPGLAKLMNRQAEEFLRMTGHMKSPELLAIESDLAELVQKWSSRR